MEESRFETQPASTRCSQNYITKDLQSKSKIEKANKAFVQVNKEEGRHEICYVYVTLVLAVRYFEQHYELIAD